MIVKSMTGYAYLENSGKDLTVSVEIKGYNSRFLDSSVFLPSWLSPLEPRIREYMASRFSRGKIDTSIRIKEHNGDISVSVNTAAARSYYKAMNDLTEVLGISEKPNLALIMGLEGVLETEKNRDNEKYWPIIERVLKSAADKFETERDREGMHTKEDILSHIRVLEDSIQIIDTKVPELELSIKTNLRARFAEVLGDSFDENRILAETAVLLVKYSISEELSRLSSHLKEFRLETEKKPVSGKKLDFLCQEINREINTIGSKSPVLEVSRAVMNMKNALENTREQLRNVE
jgi:uncharacterized protein (TIGR00255 family)